MTHGGGNAWMKLIGIDKKKKPKKSEKKEIESLG